MTNRIRTGYPAAGMAARRRLAGALSVCSRRSRPVAARALQVSKCYSVQQKRLWAGDWSRLSLSHSLSLKHTHCLSVGGGLEQGLVSQDFCTHFGCRFITNSFAGLDCI